MKQIDLTKYDILECPHCNLLCKPIKVKKNGTVVYEKHDCEFEGGSTHSFEIDIDGNIVD